MKPVVFCLLLVLLGCSSLSSATQLHCRVGEAACEGWSYKGRMNDVVCCPGLPDQGFIMSPPVCICRQGTAEDYPSGGSSGSASNFRPQSLLVLLTAFAGGLVFRSF